MAQSHPTPAIQLIQKSDFTKQLIVPFTTPSAAPNLTVPNQALIRTRLVALTTNNFTYARRGGIPYLAWWSVWPMPSPASSSSSSSSSLPPPFNDEAALAAYCRVSGWGCVEVVQSTVPGLAAGTWLAGYVPIGTRPEAVALARGEVDGHWLRTDVVPGGEGLSSVYKRYVQVPGGKEGGGGGGMDKVGLGWDALMGVLFETGFMLNRFVFSWEGEERVVHPLGMKGMRWAREDADIAGAVMVLLAPSGKTGLAFAHELRFGRPEGKRPGKVIAVGSARSREFSAGTGLFDEVLLYEDLQDASFDLGAKLGGQQQKIVVMDFGARGDAVDRWTEALKDRCERLQVLVIGADPLAQAQSKTAERIEDATSGVEQVHAGNLRERAIELVGTAKYYADKGTAWAKFKDDGTIPGLQLKWGKGMEEFSEGWDALVRGDYGPDIGLVYEI
ncbi:hypothetical protein MFIFM68171_11217 [Madurella fahalii]|uniref:Uncharacterized protein n=1 Tax=Madurella fahalii TaxID=1157608 RepID=A0ABQ0GTD6_9PEZI